MRDQVFTPLPEPIDILFPKLLAANLITKISKKPNELLRFYDPNAQCEYHLGEVGHDMNYCRPLKRRVQELITTGSLIV